MARLIKMLLIWSTSLNSDIEIRIRTLKSEFEYENDSINVGIYHKICSKDNQIVNI